MSRWTKLDGQTCSLVAIRDSKLEFASEAASDRRAILMEADCGSLVHPP